MNHSSGVKNMTKKVMLISFLLGGCMMIPPRLGTTPYIGIDLEEAEEEYNKSHPEEASIVGVKPFQEKQLKDNLATKEHR